MNPALGAFPDWMLQGMSQRVPTQPMAIKTAQKIGSGDFATLFRSGMRTSNMTPMQGLKLGAKQVLGKAALPAAIISTLAPIAEAHGERAKNTGQTIPTAIASSTRPMTSWNQPRNTMSISSRPMTTGYGNTSITSDPIAALPPTPIQTPVAQQEIIAPSPSYSVLDLFHDVNRKPLPEPDTKKAPSAPAGTTIKAQGQPQINEPQFNIDEYIAKVNQANPLPTPLSEFDLVRHSTPGSTTGQNADAMEKAYAMKLAQAQANRANALGVIQQLVPEQMRGAYNIRQEQAKQVYNPENSEEALAAKIGLQNAQAQAALSQVPYHQALASSVSDKALADMMKALGTSSAEGTMGEYTGAIKELRELEAAKALNPESPVYDDMIYNLKKQLSKLKVKGGSSALPTVTQ